MDQYYCSNLIPTLTHFFDFSFAPALLFYAYIPVAFISLFFGVLVLRNDTHSLRSKLLFTVSVIFFFLIFNEIIQWVAVYARVVQLGWQLIPFFRVSVILLSIYFAYNFIYKKDLPFLQKLFLSVIYLGVLTSLPLNINIYQFDITNCEGNSGILNSIVNILGLISGIWVFLLGLYKYRQKDTEEEDKRQIVFISLATCLFLVIFFVSNAYADLTTFYEVGLLGPIGMVVFLGFLTYMIVKFKTFNIKLLGAQALVWSLVILIGSQFFFIKSQINMILTGATLLTTMVLGYYLILGVKKERILLAELKIANEQKSEFMSFASHEIRGPMTVVKGYVSMMLEGSLGEVNPKIKDSIQKIMISANSVISLIGQYLNKSKIELGQLEYTFSVFDLGKTVKEIMHGFQVNVEQKDITLTCQADEGVFNISADEGKIKEAIGNIIDNSIKYTAKGSVVVSLAEKAGKVLIKITDTGVGIPSATIPHLFKKFSRADAKKVNIFGTGLGLFLAKTFVVAHKGKIWVESEGEGKGSTFFVELPIK